MTGNTKLFGRLLCGALFISGAGCSTTQTPAIADIAVSKAAVESATSAGAEEYAPLELGTARAKMALANKAMISGNYKQASDLATQAQADANLARTKSSSSKAQLAADAVESDITILRAELNRMNR